MSKVKCSTRLEPELFDKAKALVDKGTFESVTAVIEEALRLYFSERSGRVLKNELFQKAKALVGVDSFKTVNEVMEEAFRIYLANYTAEVWEKPLPGGWVKKLVVRENKVTFESIRSRKIYSRFNPKQYTDEALLGRGFHKVWKLKKAN